MWGSAVNIVTLPAIALAELSSKLKGPKQMGRFLLSQRRQRQHRARSGPHYFLGHAAENQVRKPCAPVRLEHDKIRVDLRRHLHHRFGKRSRRCRGRADLVPHSGQMSVGNIDERRAGFLLFSISLTSGSPIARSFGTTCSKCSVAPYKIAIRLAKPKVISEGSSNWMGVRIERYGKNIAAPPLKATLITDTPNAIAQ